MKNKLRRKNAKRKEPKKKPYRSALDNALWSFRGMLEKAPLFFLLMVFQMPLNIFLSYASIYLPSLAVAQVAGSGNPTGESLGAGSLAQTAPSVEILLQAALRVGLLILLMFVANALLSFCESASSAYRMLYRTLRCMELNQKSMDCFYQTYEKKEARDLYGRAARATEMWNGVQPITDMPRRSLKLVENVLCYCLFGTVISFVSPLLVPILTIAPAVNWCCARAYRRWEYGCRNQWANIDGKLWYVQNKPSDFAAAKDIRIYGMAGWLREIFTDLSRRRSAWDKRQVRRMFLSRIADLFVILLRDGAAYGMLIAMTLAGDITVDKFVLYFAAISTFASFVGNIMDEWNGMHQTSLDICDFREYMDLPEQDGTGEADVAPLLATMPEIAFEHVSFRYDGAKEDTLRDVNFTIKPGEKVALVGLNGAGKTTLVKLLCGLYLPTGGDVKVGGISVRKFRRKDYYRLFSPVFQEASTAFFSLAETVSGQIGGDTDFQKAAQCMRLAGLGEKIDSLPEGIHTKLDKQVNRDGTSLSGGELQKLMLARALYKDAPILVLDEPTAALDPVAENNIYLQYHNMTQEKTSLFISHRLASTQFCDRIMYLKDGTIAEEGSHRELIAQNGEYKTLYEMQSCWYKEDYTTPLTPSPARE